jgi:ankyrin repeat protein
MNFAVPKSINADYSNDALGNNTTTKNNSRKVLLRVKRKRDEDPLTALIIQERVKKPKKYRVESNCNDDNETMLNENNDVSSVFKNDKITVKEEEKALLLFRRLGTVAADDVGITHKKASKLMRKFKEIEKRRNRLNLRRKKGVEENISWYGKDKHEENSKVFNNFDYGAGADGRKKRIATTARNSRKKRSDLLNIRRKSNTTKRKSIDGKNSKQINFSDTFDIMDIDPKQQKLGKKEIPAGLLPEETATTSTVPQDGKKAKGTNLSMVATNNNVQPAGIKIMSPLDVMMDKAIFNSFREGPRFCDEIVDALNQGCNANFARYQADNTTALMAACLHGRGDIVLRLIESGSDIKLLDNDNRSAVDFAKIGKNFDIVTELIQLGGLTGVEIIQMRKEAEERSQYVYDYYYLKGVAPNNTNSNSNNNNNNSDGVMGGGDTYTNTNKETCYATNNDTTGINTASAFSNSAILDITTRYQSKFLRAADTNNYVNYINAEDLFSDATNVHDKYYGIDEFQYENDAHNLSELDDSNDSNAENYLGNEYPDSDPGILFTSEEEDEDNQYHDDYDDERCITMGDGEDYYY